MKPTKWQLIRLQQAVHAMRLQSTSATSATAFCKGVHRIIEYSVKMVLTDCHRCSSMVPPKNSLLQWLQAANEAEPQTLIVK